MGKTKREITEDQYKEFYILYLLLVMNNKDSRFLFRSGYLYYFGVNGFLLICFGNCGIVNVLMFPQLLHMYENWFFSIIPL